jgi:putative FmdB family regulatory protein
MPLYEYRCADCRAKTTVLFRSIADGAAPACSSCGSGNLVRLFSRFAAPRSEESRLERMADPSNWGGVDENDPGSVSRFMKRMGREMGDEFRFRRECGPGNVG